MKCKKMCSQDLGGTQLCISCDGSVTKSAGNFRLTDLFQIHWFSVRAFLVAMPTPQRARAEITR